MTLEGVEHFELVLDPQKVRDPALAVWQHNQNMIKHIHVPSLSFSAFSKEAKTITIASTVTVDAHLFNNGSVSR